MKKFILILLTLVGSVSTFAQRELEAHVIDMTGIDSIHHSLEQVRRANYQRLVKKILQNDELFVLFYLDVALVVDPTKETQVVESIDTDNPWLSLTNYLHGKSNIYFCPSGNQLNVAIEYMRCPLDTSIMMSDRYGMYRLSSPQELFKNRGHSFMSRKHKAVVFGGLRYDQMASDEPGTLAFRGNRGALSTYKYLRSTYAEAIYVDSLLRKHHIETALLTDDDGTEQNFRQIPGKDVDILHIASHGFYEADNDNPHAEDLPDWMLSHSGLVLSGARTHFTHEKNDGRLTAYEISQTDLTNINLVVLSACETGLGDVKDNDVYGLIKGFKKAGAGTLLVSLSEVSDTVTTLLITRFYDNIFRGDNPRRALENAQRYVRLHGSGQFNRPELWSTFVLVDDLDRNVAEGITEAEKNEFLETIIRQKDIYSENYIFPDWEEVRSKLRSDDAVVQICSYQSRTNVCYAAMIGDAKTGKCKVVRLTPPNPNEEERHSVSSFENIDNLLWEPILPYLSKKKRILIQPSGVFHNLPLEYTPSVWDKYDVCRISSLNAILDSKTSALPLQSIALFGGLDYDFNEEGEVLTRASTRSIHKLAYLAGTKIETDSIAQLFNEKGLSVSIFQGRMGTEKCFKDIATTVDIIHIASHTFLFNGNRGFIFDKAYSIMQYFLGRCMIALSGANLVLNQLHLHLNGNDGWLHGTEIAKMNLNHVGMVVMSGKTISSNGTLLDSPWDLAKAFKYAGVKTIMGAIKYPTDDFTAIMMTEFYKNLINGMTNRQSLRNAIVTLRNFEEYDDPEYWTSFVLIDAFE